MTKKVNQGTNKDDVIYGDPFNDVMHGGAGDDRLWGLDGDDRLWGDAGADELWGGSGADRFLFAKASDAQGDAIMDWYGGDLIDLSLIDANAETKGDQAFSFIGGAAFTGVAGQLRVEQAHGGTYVTGDVNGDGVADFGFSVGTDTLAAKDFLL